MRCHPPLDVYVPASQDAEKELGIDPGSAIVGRMFSGPGRRLLVYYEGNRYGSVNMGRFAEKAMHAASRMQNAYPTVAHAVVDHALLRTVGKFDGERVDLTDRAALEEWVGHPLDVLQLAVSR